MSNRQARRFIPGDLVRDGGKIRLQVRKARQHCIAMLGKHLASRAVGRFTLGPQLGKRLYGGDGHARRLEPHHELQPVQVLRRIQPVSPAAAPDRAQQACLLVVTQRMRGDPDGRGHLADG